MGNTLMIIFAEEAVEYALEQYTKVDSIDLTPESPEQQEGFTYRFPEMEKKYNGKQEKK